MNEMNRVNAKILKLPLAAKKVRKYVHKDTSPESTARRITSSKRNWDVLQLTNIVGQLRMVANRAVYPKNYTPRAGDGSSEARAKRIYAIDLVADALAAIKAHNKDPKNNPLP